MSGENKHSNGKKSNSHEIYIMPLPQDTVSLIKSIPNYKQNQLIENLFLRLYRYAEIVAEKYIEDNKEKLKKVKVTQYFPIDKNKTDKHKNDKSKMNKIENEEYNFSKTYNHLLSDLDEKIHKILCKQGIQYEKYTVSQAYQSRWAMGIGGGSPYGNLLLPTLHPLYGFPYIPASTLKGLMRHWWNCCNGENDDNNEELKRLFGTSENETTNVTSDDEKKENEKSVNGQSNEARAGQLIFFDSYPSANCKGRIVRDDMTPHYPDYYNNRGKTAPTDDQNPIPIEFLCIENFTFNIYIGSREKLSDDERTKLKNTLEYVLSEQGIGSRTALGYGRGNAKN